MAAIDLAGERQESQRALARGIFNAFKEGGPEALVGLTDADVEWLPFTGLGRRLRGHGGLRVWANTLRRDGAEVMPSAYRFEAISSGDVLATGTLRVSDGRGFRERQFAWMFSFGDDGRLQRVEAFRSVRAALATLDARDAG